jgi:hypothetical protein
MYTMSLCSTIAFPYCTILRWIKYDKMGYLFDTAPRMVTLSLFETIW